MGTMDSVYTTTYIKLLHHRTTLGKQTSLSTASKLVVI